MNSIKIKLIVFFIFALCKITFAQTGTSSSPFTSLAQAMGVSSAGIYYFNIGTKSFNTQVNAYGWVLIASDLGGSSASSLPQVTSLTPITRGILTPSILSNLASISAVGVSSSDGIINVTTINSTIISRVNNNNTLNQGFTDNFLFGTPWTGSGASYLNSQLALCNDITTLDVVVYHPCGDANKFHWLPNTAQLAEVWSSGFISNSVSFNLWVQSSATVSPLPIELLNFDAVYNKSTSEVDLNWTTSTEMNNDYFTIERSIDGESFSELKTVKSKGNNGNSTTNLNYQISDTQPISGTSYYRLKQIDFNGNYKYFKIVVVDFIDEQNIFIYPNPLNNKESLNINIIGYKGQEVFATLKDIMGREFLSKSLLVEQSNQSFILDELKYLLPGTYFITVTSLNNKCSTHKIVLR